MALTKQAVAINFSQGLDLKSDPFQVGIGKFLALNNMVFTTAGRLSKRNGFSHITDLPSTADATTLTSYQNNLIATGANLYAYSADTSQWLTPGTVQPVELSVQPLVRVSTSQSAQDAAVASNGIVCTTYLDNGVVYYQISDSSTGQQIVNRTSVLSIDTASSAAALTKVVLLGNYFVVTYLATVSGDAKIRALIISSTSPTTAPSVKAMAGTVYATTLYDTYVANNTVYFAYHDTSSTLAVASMSAGFIIGGATQAISLASAVTCITLTADISNPAAPVIWIAYLSNTTIKAAAYSVDLRTILLAPTTVFANSTTLNVAAVAQNGILYVLNDHNYTYATGPTTVGTHLLEYGTLTQAGVAAGHVNLLDSVGLASKAFIANGTAYVLAAFDDTGSNQPTYFLIDFAGNIYLRLAYSNGGGVATNGLLPSVSVVGDSYYISYLIKDFLASVNKGTNLPSGTPTAAIYTQTGVNLAQFTIDSAKQYSSEIANALHLTGGQLWMYDGVKPVEHGFHLYPENITATSTADITTGGTALTSSNTLTVSSAAGLVVGMNIADVTNATYIPAGTTITSIVSTTVTMSANTTHSISGDNIKFTGNISSAQSPLYYIFTYEWTDNQGNLHRSAPSIPLAVTVASGHSSVKLFIPTLRLTAKVSPNPVRIVGYRWSATQQTYYQVTSLTSPLVNSTTTDIVTFVDLNSDAQILGNTLLYTTGGVIEDIAAPASIASCLFKSRLFLVTAEDRNLLWFSKQVIEGVPVEMSDLLTLYIAPTSGAQGSTGPITALSAMDDKLIIFKRDAIYYITGTGPDNTGANNDFSDPIFITSSVGCSNPSSIVLMPNGIMFQSDKGIWLLGRDLGTNYIGAPVESYNSQAIESAQSIPATNQVRFVMENTTLMYDYFYNQWGTFSNINAISSTLYQGMQTYITSNGAVYQETPGSYSDGSSPVLMSFTTSWLGLGGLQGYQRFYELFLLGTYYTPFKLNVQLAYNYNPSPTQATLVVPDNYTAPWGGEAQWGSGGPWGGPGNIFEPRIFPSIQKCESVQITVNEIFDSSLGAQAGQGLSLSGLNLVVGVKRGWRTQKASTSFG